MDTKIKKTAVRIYLADIRRVIAGFESWEADCAQDREDGYRPHYCPHGTNLWTDYDNICGPCEDGFSSPRDYVDMLAADAPDKAKAFWDEMDKLKQAYLLMTQLHLDRDFDFIALMDKIMKRYGLLHPTN